MSVSALFTYLNAQTCVILGFVFLLAYWYLRTRAAPNLPPGPWALPGLGNVLQMATKDPGTAQPPPGAVGAAGAGERAADGHKVTYLRTRAPPNLPPGPWALPGLGNVLQMATKVPHLTWTELGKTYGPVVYLRLGSQQIVVLNSYSAIHEALGRKGEDFSSRPAWYTFQQMGFMDYGKCYSAIHEALGRKGEDFSSRPAWYTFQQMGFLDYGKCYSAIHEALGRKGEDFSSRPAWYTFQQMGFMDHGKCYSAIHEALGRKGEDFSSRPAWYTFQQMGFLDYGKCYSAIHEALGRKGEDFSSRPAWYTFQQMGFMDYGKCYSAIHEALGRKGEDFSSRPGWYTFQQMGFMDYGKCYSAIHEALGRKGEDFSSRPAWYTFQQMGFMDYGKCYSAIHEALGRKGEDFSSRPAWYTFQQMGFMDYGKCYSAIHEALGKREEDFSSRPAWYTFQQMGFMDYGKWYLFIMKDWIVVLNSYSVIHEALGRKGEDFSSRPTWYTFQQMGFMDYGIIMLPYGPFWKQQRKFTIMGLRDFGFGKRSLEGKIAEESQGLREEILKKGDTPFNIRLLLQNAVGNVICSIVLGKRFEYEDKKFEKIMEAFDQNLGAEQQLSAVVNFFPWTRHIPVVKKAIKLVKENVENCMATMREDIAEHKASFDPNDIRDFIDTFLLEMRNQEGEGGGEFTNRQLEYLIGDLFLAGTETTSSTLTWALLYMLRHPEVQDKTICVWFIYSEVFPCCISRQGASRDRQHHRTERHLNILDRVTVCNSYVNQFMVPHVRYFFRLFVFGLSILKFFRVAYLDKVHQEIDNTIGHDVTPSISHRSLLPYTEAVITEVMRINPIAATGALHNTSNDTTLFGYDIPKDTAVFPNLWAVLHDPEVYPDPDVFKPERFLDDSKFKKGDTFIPFSLGRRACLGEQLARMELFLFFTSLMQHFTFKLPEGAALPSTRGKAGITNNAEDFDLCAIPRE
ncbi:uncharacterized protein [Branchiostoma lanceolatum]|uniref:uncharacterized protein n=1 Tax=Branchiostoma lanceolatum TaxID=7740 RepID=UPI003455838F